jgi:hypothetical protein
MKNKINKLHKKYIDYIRAMVIGIVSGAYLFFIVIAPKTEASELPLELPLEVTNIGTTSPSITPKTWNDAIREVFPKDEAGRMIRICMKENGKQNKQAINYNTNGTYDYSWCQVNSCHKPKEMTDIEWKLYLEDPDNHAKEVRRIFLNQWWNAWAVFNKGLVK